MQYNTHSFKALDIDTSIAKIKKTPQLRLQSHKFHVNNKSKQNKPEVSKGGTRLLDPNLDGYGSTLPRNLASYFAVPRPTLLPTVSRRNFLKSW